MRALAARDRRALKFGASIVGAALLLFVGVLPALRAFATARDTLASERGLLARERDVVRGAPAAEAKLRAVEATLATFAYTTFDAAEPELATLEVARLIETIAKLSELDVRSAPLGIEVTADEITRLRVRVTGEADFAQLMLLLHRIESGPVLLRIDELAVRSDDRERSTTTETSPLLTFAITLSGTGLADRARLLRLDAEPMGMRQREDLPSETALLEALIDDPFRPGVNLPGSERGEETLPVDSAPNADARLAIMGTVVLPHDRGLVMAALGTEPPRLIRVGDRIGGLRLVRVEPGAAEFEDESGSRTIVRVPKPGA
jgi:hypothetical protein